MSADLTPPADAPDLLALRARADRESPLPWTFDGRRFCIVDADGGAVTSAIDIYTAPFLIACANRAPGLEERVALLRELLSGMERERDALIALVGTDGALRLVAERDRLRSERDAALSAAKVAEDERRWVRADLVNEGQRHADAVRERDTAIARAAAVETKLADLQRRYDSTDEVRMVARAVEADTVARIVAWLRAAAGMCLTADSIESGAWRGKEQA